MNSNKKFIECLDVCDYEVWTDDGWVDIEQSNLTVPYDVWILKTETHQLECADNHIIFDSDGNERFVSELGVGERIHTDSGLEAVVSVIKTEQVESMYDLQLPDTSKHRYFTNGILSHNTTIMTIYSLWTTLFSGDKTVLIVANKEATAIEILRRIRMAYEMIPNWLKPGIKEYGKTAVVFSNDSRIIISSTSSSSSRGQTANCVCGKTIIRVSRGGVDLGCYTIEAFMEEFEDSFDFESESSGMIFKFKAGEDFKVLSNTGFESFRGFRLNTSTNMLSIKTRGKLSLKCTDEHLIFKSPIDSVSANTLCVGVPIFTEFGLDIISKITIDSSEDIVYDLIGVENGNKYYGSGVLIHNCLIVDECISGDSSITIRNKTTGEIKTIKLKDLLKTEYA